MSNRMVERAPVGSSAVLERALGEWVEQNRGQVLRRELLEAAASVNGVYVPEHYTPTYGSDGRLGAFEHVQGGIPTGRDSVRIVLNEENQGPNGSIQFLASE